nr:MAG TPA: hypothetical protein [Caudoviricetes sp.]
MGSHRFVSRKKLHLYKPSRIQPATAGFLFLFLTGN